MQKLLDALRINAAANPGEIAIRDDAGILTRGEFFAAVAHTAQAFRYRHSGRKRP